MRTLQDFDQIVEYWVNEAEVGDRVTIEFEDGSQVVNARVIATSIGSTVELQENKMSVAWSRISRMEVPDLKDPFLDYEEGWYRLKEGRPDLVFRFYEGEWTVHGLHGYEYQVYASSSFARKITSGGVEKL